MRLTALCVCGTLLAFSGLSWTAVDSDEENLLDFGGFGPCAVTMRPEGPCRQERDEGSCPYLFSVPPLTFHLPKRLRELENIVEEVQKLKDSVDELRMMCADCTVRQTDVACAGQTERERENLHVGTDGYENERKRLEKGQSEVVPKDFHNGSQTKQSKDEHLVAGDAVLEKNILEEKGRNDWESERSRDRTVINDERKAQPEVNEEGKTEGGREKGKEKSKPTAVPAGDESDRITDLVIKKMVEKQNQGVDTDRRKGENGNGLSPGGRGDSLETESERKIMTDKTEDSDLPVWRDVTQEAEKRAKTEEERGHDGIKMSKNPDKHTNKEREGLTQEGKKEIEKGAKTAERNNKKAKQTESIRGMEKTIKEGVKEDVRQTEKEIKTEGGQVDQSVQRDSDGELALRKVTERTDFASIAPTASAMTSPPSHSPEDLVRAFSLASSPPLPSSHSISSVSQGMTTSVDGTHIERTDLETAVMPERPGAEENFMTVGSPTTTTATTDALSAPSSSGQIPGSVAGSVSTTRTSPEESTRLQVASTVPPATFTTSIENLDAGSLQTGLAGHSTASQEPSLMPNTNAGNKLSTGEGSVSGNRPASKPEMKPNLPKNKDHPAGAPLSDEQNNHGPKQKPPHHQPMTKQTPQPGKTKPDILMTHQNQNSTLEPKSHDAERITDPNLSVNRRLNPDESFSSTQKPLSHQTVIDAADSSEDRLTEILNIAQDSKPEERPVYSVEIDTTGGAQETQKNMRSEGKPAADENQKLNHHLAKVVESEEQSEIREATSHKPKNIQRTTTGLPQKHPSLETEFEQDSSFGTEFTPEHGPTRLQDQPAKADNNVPDRQQTGSTSQNHPDLPTDQGGLKLEPDQTDLEFTSLQTEQIPVPTTISVLHEIFQAGADKPSRPVLTKGSPTRPVAKPGATSVQKSEPSLEVEPSLKTEADSIPPHISTTSSGYPQKVQTDSAPTSGPVKLITDVTHSAGGAEFNAREIISLEPNSFGSGPFPRHHTLSDGVTTSPNSRATSDPWPQTATQTPSIQMTTRPNRIMLSILPSDAPASDLRPTEQKQVSSGDKSLQNNFPRKLEETRHRNTPDPDRKMFLPAPSPRAQMTSTISPQLSSTKPAVSGPELMGPALSTASTRELRVKINQVAAFFNNSVSPNGRHPDPDRHPKVLLEGKQGRGWPDGKLPSTTQGKIISFQY